MVPSSHFSHVIAATMYHTPTTCCSHPWGRQHRSLAPGSDMAVSYSYYGYRSVIRERNGPQEYWHLHTSDRRNTLMYVHTTSRTLPTCDMSIDSLKVDSHIACRSHTEPIPFPCHAVPLRVYNVSFPFDLHSAAVSDSHLPCRAHAKL